MTEALPLPAGVAFSPAGRVKAAAGPAAWRLLAGGLIDRGRPVRFTFDGRAMTGYAGDTLASALMANGVKVVGRSFKYHRPRGIVAAGPEEPNALMELGSGARREPNSKATTAELWDGLEARSQNRWPSLRFDMAAVNGLFAPLLVAGFYYKTFKWPAPLWERLYEPAIRRAAGLGRASAEPDPDRYDTAWAHCDVLVVGGGPAGIAAALAAGRAGARVILCEQDFLCGGRLLVDAYDIEGIPGAQWLAAGLAELRAMPDVRLMTRTTVFGVFDGGVYGAVEHAAPLSDGVWQTLWRIAARRTVVAGGAVERPIVFPGNDVPGVMNAAAFRTYIARYAALPGRRAAFFVNNDDAWRSVAAAVAAGIEVAAVIDPRGEAPPEFAALAGRIDVIPGEVVGVKGGHGVRRVTVRETGGRMVTVAADCLAVSGGWNPDLALASSQGGRPVWHDGLSAFTAGAVPPGMRLAGAAAGVMGLGGCLRGGHEAGVAAAADCGKTGASGDAPHALDEGCRVSALFHVMAPGKAFVDLQHDVTAQDVALAQREGFTAVEHLKRYTTLGMATDQGRLSNVNGLAIMAAATGRSMDETGTTMFRAPVMPVTIGVFAGHRRGQHFYPTRLTPSHGWAVENGASFVDAGMWKRAQWYARPGETWQDSVNREARCVREAVGFCDVSTLGKIDVMGPDAGALLDRVYVNGFSNLPVGRARYGLMLREDGFALDDGTVSRFADDRYFVTTTTANAGAVLQHLEFCRQVLWPGLDVQLTPATEAWAQFSVAGPRARALLQRLVASHDLSNAAFPFMAAAEVTLHGDMPARVMRISFSGELAYEIGVAADLGDALARNLALAGAELGVMPYGTEALGVLRIEKGHVAGPELDGRTTAGDLGLGKMMSARKDFVGRVLAGREALLDPRRAVVVGMRCVDPQASFGAGAHVFAQGVARGPEEDLGHVTSACFSPVLGRWIGLGLVRGGRERHGEVHVAYDPIRRREAAVELCHPVFYDPAGARQRE